MSHSYVNPAGLSPPVGYTHVVSGTGRLVFIAGQVARDAEGRVVGVGDLERQLDRAFENLEACLASVDATVADLVKVNVYVVGYTVEMRPALIAVHDRHLSGDRPPASTLIGVQSLAHPDLLVEVDGIALVSNQSA